MRIKLSILAALLLSACSPVEFSPEVEAHMEANAIDPATKETVGSGNDQMIITVNKSRKIALVQGIPNVTTPAMMLRAVSKKTGCRTNHIVNVPELNGANANKPVTHSVYRQFGGQIPVLMNC